MYRINIIGILLGFRSETLGKVSHRGLRRLIVYYQLSFVNKDDTNTDSYYIGIDATQRMQRLNFTQFFTS
jgi:hypothetical protein